MKLELLLLCHRLKKVKTGKKIIVINEKKTFIFSSKQNIFKNMNEFV